MFENLLFQEHAKEQLETMLKDNRIPPTMLFVGPEGSGKLTAALEFARILSCERDGLWNCDCPQCTRHRSLTHPDILLFGPREFPQEVEVAAEYFCSFPTNTSYFAFVRSIRKILRRFDAALWSGEEQRLSKAIPSIEGVEELLQEMALLVGKGKKQSFNPLTERIVEIASMLETDIPDGIPVFMIRNMASWAALTPMSQRKTIIMQNADMANESARNAMLKILEEPPDTVRFILTSSKRASIIATILSRSRLISFNQRTKAESQQIIARLFKVTEDIDSIPSYFQKKNPYSAEKASRDAALFLGALLARAMARNPDLSGKVASELAKNAESEKISALSALKTITEGTHSFGAKNARFADSFFVFIRATSRQLTAIIEDSSSSAALMSFMDRISSKLRELGVQYRALNRSPELLLEAFANLFGDYDESSL